MAKSFRLIFVMSFTYLFSLNSHADPTTMNGDIVSSSLTLTGPVLMSSLTATNASITTAAVSSATITNLTIASLTGINVGKLLQIVNSNTTSATTVSTTTYTSTNSSVSITPKLSSSYILVLGYTGYARINATSLASGNGTCSYTVFRGNTDLAAGTNGIAFKTASVASQNQTSPIAFWYLDSPATTSTTTYTVKIHSDISTTTCQWADPNTNSSITLIEIAS